MSAPLAVYEYTDPCGELIFQKYRFSDPDRGKRFAYKSRSPETGAWEWRQAPDAGKYLYRLPALRAAIRSGGSVFWTEGEKDADTLTSLGLVATTHGAALTATAEQAEWFRGLGGHVLLLLDNDPPGAACVLRRLALLTSVDVQPGQISLLYSPYGKDVTDHVEAGHGLDELAQARSVRSIRRLRAEARKYTPATRRRYGYDQVTA
jgi:DNA primase